MGVGARDTCREEAARLLECIASPVAGGSPRRTRDAAFLLADCAYDSGDYDLAVKLYSRAAEAHIDTPEATRALFQIGNCYWHLGLDEQARTTYRRAIFDLDRLELPLEPGGHYYRSIALWRLGDEA